MSIEHVAVDLGYGFVKAISSSGKRAVFPSLVGGGFDLGIYGTFSNENDYIDNMHILFDGKEYFIGRLAEKESRNVSRVFEQERFTHEYTKILMNIAISIVTEGKTNQVNLSTGLPLDFFNAQREKFKESIIGIQPTMKWLTGKKDTIKINIKNTIILPQGASAIFSALINKDGKFSYPQLMEEGNLIALIDIGFRTTDFVVVEVRKDSSFVPKVKLSGTIDDGIINLQQQIKGFFKKETGGLELNGHHMTRIFKSEYLNYKGKKIHFTDVIQHNKEVIATNISDKLKSVWVEEVDLFDGIFLAGGGGKMFFDSIQPHFNNRVEMIHENQFANAIGYLRLGKKIFT